MEQIDGFKYYEATPFQQGLFLKQSVSKKPLSPFNISVSRRIKKVDIEALKKALKYIIERHEILRTSLTLANGVIKQKVWPFDKNLIDFEEISIVNNTELGRLLQDIQDQNFSLTQAPWINFKLIFQSGNEYLLVITIHHLISDAESIKILLNELSVAYKCFASNQNINLIESYQFGEYYEACVRFNNSEKGGKHKLFWKKIVTNLPKKNLSNHFSNDKKIREKSYSVFIQDELQKEYGKLSAETIKSFYGNVAFIVPKNGASISFLFNSEITSKLKELSELANVNMAVLLIASFKFLTTRLTGETETIVGINTSLRDRDELKGVIGFMINTVLLRHKKKDNQNFVEFAKDVNLSFIKACRYKSYCFDQILYDSDISLEQVGSLFFNIIEDNKIINDIEKPVRFNYGKGYPYFDINIHIQLYVNVIEVRCEYKTELFQAFAIESFLTEYLKLVDELIDFKEIVLKPTF